jgi:hypothetical protein
MPRELDQLLKIVGMLSSTNENEAGVAAGQLMRVLKQDGLDIHKFKDIVANGYRKIGKDRSIKPSDDWRDILAECARHPDRLNAYEQGFVSSMKTWHGEPTPKQRKVLLGIFARVRRA